MVEPLQQTGRDQGLDHGLLFSGGINDQHMCARFGQGDLLHQRRHIHRIHLCHTGLAQTGKQIFQTSRRPQAGMDRRVEQVQILQAGFRADRQRQHLDAVRYQCLQPAGQSRVRLDQYRALYPCLQPRLQILGGACPQIDQHPQRRCARQIDHIPHQFCPLDLSRSMAARIRRSGSIIRCERELTIPASVASISPITRSSSCR